VSAQLALSERAQERARHIARMDERAHRRAGASATAAADQSARICTRARHDTVETAGRTEEGWRAR